MIIKASLGRFGKGDFRKWSGLLCGGFWIVWAGLSVWAQSSTPAIYRSEIEPHWFLDDSRFWYRNENRGGTREFVVVDAAKGIRSPAFDHLALARQMGEQTDPKRLPIERLEFSDDGNSVVLVGREKSWELNLESGQLKEPSAGQTRSGGLEPLRFLRRSENGGEETSLAFKNELRETVQLFWLDLAGERQPYGTIEPGQERRQHTFAKHVWLVTDQSGTELAAFAATDREGRAVIDGKGPRPRGRSAGRRSRDSNATSVKSGDGRHEAFVRDHNLWLRRLANQGEQRLTAYGNATNSFHRDAIRDRAIGMNYDQPDFPDSLPEVIWSPDSRKLIAIRTTVVSEPRVHLVVSSPADQLQPKLDSYPYIKPGDPIPMKQLHLFDTESGAEIELDASMFANPWDLSRIVWSKDSSRFHFLYNQRGHQVLRVLEVIPGESESDAKPDERNPAETQRRARVRVCIDETSETFLDYSNKTYLNILEDSEEMIWMSERDGWNHLYLVDLKDGRVKNPITKGNWVVRGVDRVDGASRQIWFRACGVFPEQDPYFVHYGRIGFDGSDLVFLTEGDGTHSLQFSPDRQFIIDTWSRVDQPPVHELRSARDGSFICRLEVANASEATEAGYLFPERFAAKGRDGETVIYGILHRPKGFDPSRQYPVVENIYAGPHGQHVPKPFRARYRHQQEIADRGFVVVQIDGMGTNWRSKAFHNAAWKNLKDAGFPDRIAWMKAASRTFPWVDITRVGVYGGSAGGQNAMRAVLDHADFYRAAAADCGCHDNRMDKIWWNEAWMGWPVDECYAKSSNTEDAAMLGGKLLLTVGELDKNVDPSSTYQVVNALKRAGKDFEFMLMTGQGHGAAESDFGRKRRADFFARHLFGDRN